LIVINCNYSIFTGKKKIFFVFIFNLNQFYARIVI
jgi:hypothetical protein